MIQQLEELKKVLKYDDWSGEFIWIQKKQLAGRIDQSGYRVINHNNQTYSAHRLAWYYKTGVYPSRHIDHKNKCKWDNRFANLKLT